MPFLSILCSRKCETMKNQTTVEIYQGKGRKPFRWRQKSANGKVIGQGQGYTRRSSARRGAQRAVGTGFSIRFINI